MTSGHYFLSAYLPERVKMDFLKVSKASDSLIHRSQSIDLGDGERIHLQYCKEWKSDA